MNKEDIERFNSKFVKSRRCWMWIGCYDQDGYGLFKMNGTMHRAHRMAWIINRGEILPGRFICHECDTPSCVNPNHLFQATPAGNSNDRNKKFRQAFGERNGGSKLREGQVKKILRLYDSGISQDKLAAMFGVGQTSISRITRRTHWKHIK